MRGVDAPSHGERLAVALLLSEVFDLLGDILGSDDLAAEIEKRVKRRLDNLASAENVPSDEGLGVSLDHAWFVTREIIALSRSPRI